MSILKSKLQLLGVSCMFIAAKYEEIYPPGIKKFADITDNTYITLTKSVYKFICAPKSFYFFRFSNFAYARTRVP